MHCLPSLTGPATLYKFEIEVGTLDADQVKTELSALDLPVPLSEDTEISQINITTGKMNITAVSSESKANGLA